MLTKAINTETKLANTIKSACISPEYKPLGNAGLDKQHKSK
jgi:hypothetical protein